MTHKSYLTVKCFYSIIQMASNAPNTSGSVTSTFVVALHEVPDVRLFTTYERATEYAKVAIDAGCGIADITLTKFTFDIENQEWHFDHEYEILDIASNTDEEDDHISVLDSDEDETSDC